MKQTKKIFKYLWLAIFLAVIFCGLVLWLMFGNLTPVKARILNFLPVPIAFVGSEPVLFSTFSEAKKELGAQASDKEIFDALVKNFAYKQLAESLKLEPFYANKTTPGSLTQELDEYKTALKNYFNSKVPLNKDTYELAGQIKLRWEAGESPESLSNQYNQDDFSKTFKGEAGKINQNILLPEIFGQIRQYKPGQIVIVPSRLGVHIVKIVSVKNEDYELEQIFLKTSGFENWLATELSHIKIKNIIKI